MTSLLSYALIFLISLLSEADGYKLVMTVFGGPYHCLSPAHGKDAVLYGDVWDRGYRYNATTDKDLNLCEGGHSNKNVEGMAQGKDGKIIITAGSDGAVAFWDAKTNKTLKRTADVAGAGIPLSELMITPNQILILGANHESKNLFFLPLIYYKER